MDIKIDKRRNYNGLYVCKKCKFSRLHLIAIGSNGRLPKKEICPKCKFPMIKEKEYELTEWLRIHKKGGKNMKSEDKKVLSLLINNMKVLSKAVLRDKISLEHFFNVLDHDIKEYSKALNVKISKRLYLEVI